jgi:hypothetical protein
MVVKDFCASDWATGASAANAVAAIRTNTTESAMRDFIFSVLLFFFRSSLRESFGDMARDFKLAKVASCINFKHMLDL